MTKASDLARGYSEGIFAAAKLYPANSTTNSTHGVSDIAKLKAVLNKMEDIGMPLLIHGEVTDAAVDVFDREAVFIREILKPLIHEYPKLKVVLEHITTSEAVDFDKPKQSISRGPPAAQLLSTSGKAGTASNGSPKGSHIW